MTDLEKLQHFVDPYYQEVDDEDLLNDYLTTYTYPECAASHLWYELQGKLSFSNDGLTKISTGAEKFEYASLKTLQEACSKNGDYYKELCKELNNIGSVAVRVSKATVGGVTEDYGSSN